MVMVRDLIEKILIVLVCCMKTSCSQNRGDKKTETDRWVNILWQQWSKHKSSRLYITNHAVNRANLEFGHSLVKCLLSTCFRGTVSAYTDCKARGGKVVSNVFCLPPQYRKDVIPSSGIIQNYKSKHITKSLPNIQFLRRLINFRWPPSCLF